MSRAFQRVSLGVFAAIETIYGGDLGYVAGGSELALSEAPHKDHIHFYARNSIRTDTFWRQFWLEKGLKIPF